MITLFLDIETLPGDESLREEITRQISVPGSYKKQESIREWEETKKPQEVEKKYRETALKGHIGRILCIGYIKEAGEKEEQDVITGEEPDILQKFWELAIGVDLYVGFNIFDFDLKFIMQRSIVHTIKPSKLLDFTRYRSEPIYDVMREWVMWDMRDAIALDTLAKTLGLKSSKEVLEGNGSKVYDYYIEGKLQEIYKYCMADVEVTRQLYRRMNFLE